MNNLIASLAYEYAELGEEASESARIILPLVWKAQDTPLSAREYITLVQNLWVVNHVSTKKSHSKLDGGCSVSTDCHNCKFCRSMWKQALKEIENKGSTNIICAFCYSDTNGKCHKGLANRNMLNKAILQILIPQEIWYEVFSIPMMAEFFRDQSFGETDNVIEARNFIRMNRAVERVWGLPNAAWGKNAPVWAEAFKVEGKPDSMTYVQSSPRLNVRTPIAPCIKPWCDHRFTVFSPEYLAKHPEIKINCGGRSCMECIKAHKRCYFADPNEFDINEELK